MKTWRIIFWVVLSIGLTVAVSIGCALRSDVGWTLDDLSIEISRGHIAEWQVHRTQTWPAQPQHCSEFRGGGFSVLWLTSREPYDLDSIPNPPLHKVVSGRSGWPMRAMKWSVCLEMENPGGTIFGAYEDPRSIFVGGVDAPRWTHSDMEWFDQHVYRRIPLMPIGVGFASNTVFWMAVTGSLWLICRAIRRANRRRCGLCPNCAYVLSGLHICSECGLSEVPGKVDR